MNFRSVLAALVLSALLGAGLVVNVYTWRPMPAPSFSFPCGYAVVTSSTWIKGGYCPQSGATGTRPMHDVAAERS